MKKVGKLISLLLVLAMCLSFVTPAFAAEITTDGGTAKAPVVLNVEPAIFSVTIPTGLPVEVNASGGVWTADDAKIVNNSHGPVKVVGLSIEAVNGWTIANYATDLRNEKVDSNQISMEINSCQTTGADAIAFSAANFNTMLAKNDADTDECAIEYYAKVTPLSEVFTTDTVANVVFTIDWDKVEEAEDPVYFNQPYNTTYYGMNVSIVFFEDETAMLYINGVPEVDSENPTPYPAVYDGNTVTVDGMVITIADDKASLSVNMDGETLVLTANTTPHELYREDPYILTTTDGELSITLHEDGSATFSEAGAISTIPTGVITIVGNELMMDEGEGPQLMGYISMDGTQVVVPGLGILTRTVLKELTDENATSLTYDFTDTTGYLVVSPQAGLTLLRVSAAHPTAYEVAGATLTIVNNDTGETSTIVPVGNSMEMMDENCYMCSPGFIVVPADGYSMNGIVFPKAGIYAFPLLAQDAMGTTNVIATLDWSAGPVHGVYYDSMYSCTVDGQTTSFVFHEDGSCDMYTNGELTSTVSTGSMTYEPLCVINKTNGDRMAISTDGSTLTLGEQIYVIDCLHENTETQTFAATCTTQGCSGGKVCLDCGRILTKDAIIPALGHSYDGGTITTEATCAQDGVKTYTCAGCGDQYTEVIPMTNSHSYNSVVTTAATCTTDGVLTYTCINCNDQYTESIPAAGHTANDTYSCSSCGVAAKEYAFSASDYKAKTGIDVSSGDVEIPTTFYDTNKNWYLVIGIAESAFANCTELTSVIIPSSVTTIGNYAFQGCTSLTSVFIPNSVTFIGSSAFDGCTNLTDVVFEENASVLSLTKSDVPNTSKLKTIGSYAFRNCNNLSEITIPDGVTSIGQYAFYGCSALVKIIIPTDITVINDYVFYNCSSLADLTIPDNVTSIGHYAFYHCAQLTEIIIPENVKTINHSAFRSCVGLSSIVIPDSVTSISSYAFSYCSGLQDVTIGKGLTTVGDHSFYYCTQLTDVTIPENVKTVGDYAFAYCAELIDVVAKDGLVDIREGAFGECANLIKVTLPNSVINIGDYAFYRCHKLANITIPNGVSTVGYSAFRECIGITDITIPSSVTSVDERAFQTCTGLKNLTIDYGVTSFGRAAFADCTSLTSVILPDSVISIGNDLFYGCTNLTTAKISNNLTWISSSAFFKCTSLTKVEIGKNVTSVGTTPFYACTNLKSVYITDLDAWCNIDWDTAASTPFHDSGYGNLYLNGELLTDLSALENTTIISDYAFYNCQGLTNVTIPGSITSIGESAFYNSSLTDVTIAEGVATIGGSAFCYCESLTNITLPEGMTSIGGSAFYSCSSLVSIKIPNSVRSLGSAVFYYCENLKQVTLSESISVIGMSAFEGCSSLTAVVIPNSVTWIDVDAFDACTKLESVTIGINMSRISRDAFSSCYVLGTVNYRGTAEEWANITIGTNNTKLTSATINYNYGMIFFTIDETEYRAEEGMTWIEWVESDYNTDSITIDTLLGCSDIENGNESISSDYAYITG